MICYSTLDIIISYDLSSKNIWFLTFGKIDINVLENKISIATVGGAMYCSYFFYVAFAPQRT